MTCNDYSIIFRNIPALMTLTKVMKMLEPKGEGKIMMHPYVTRRSHARKMKNKN